MISAVRGSARTNFTRRRLIKKNETRGKQKHENHTQTKSKVVLLIATKTAHTLYSLPPPPPPPSLRPVSLASPLRPTQFHLHQRRAWRIGSQKHTPSVGAADAHHRPKAYFTTSLFKNINIIWELVRIPQRPLLFRTDFGEKKKVFSPRT